MIKRVRQAFANWLFRGVTVRNAHFGGESITSSPAGVGDVVRWSASQNPVAAGDLGMDTATGRGVAFVGGVPDSMAIVGDPAGGGGGSFRAVPSDPGLAGTLAGGSSFWASLNGNQSITSTAVAGTPVEPVSTASLARIRTVFQTPTTLTAMTVIAVADPGGAAGIVSLWIFKNGVASAGPFTFAIGPLSATADHTFSFSVGFAAGDLMSIGMGQDVLNVALDETRSLIWVYV